MASNGKNGVSNGANGLSQANAAENIGPLVGRFTNVGPVIQVPGDNQTYSSPYVQPATPVRFLNSPRRPVYTRDRHPWRAQPRNLFMDPAGYGCAACGLADDAPVTDTSKTILGLAVAAGISYLIVKYLVDTPPPRRPAYDYGHRQWVGRKRPWQGGR